MADGVSLVAMDARHLEATRQWLSSAAFRLLFDSLGGAPEAEENRLYWERRWADRAQRCFAIVGPDGRHIGNGGLIGIDPRRSKAELWLYLAPDAQGRGFGRRALRALLATGFDELGLNRIHLRVVGPNERARRFYLANGFREEGVAREDSRFDGVFVDTVCMGLLAREFPR